jgi:Epoxide hydrolase N terminus
VPDDVLDDLADRLRRTRFTRPTASAWRAGIDPDCLRELVTYWRTDFDWRAQERELNAVAHYTVVLDGQRVHFVHVRAATHSRAGDAYATQWARRRSAGAARVRASSLCS